jgi:choline dehydrogenase-like flavoprotein
MDTVGSSVNAYFPQLEGRPRYNEDGAMGLHAYIPFWDYKGVKDGTAGTPRGYHVEIGGSFGDPGMGVGSGLDGYGSSLRADVNRRYGSRINFTQRGEMIPNAKVVLRDRYQHQRQVRHPGAEILLRLVRARAEPGHALPEAMKELIDKLGGTLIGEPAEPAKAISKGGEIIHEVGAARMGKDAKDSVVNQFGKSWDVDNLYLTDGSVFASKAHKNPTLTIMALAMRSSENIAARLRSGEL